MTRSSINTSHYRSAAGWLAAAVVLFATAGIARAQNNAPAAAGLAPPSSAPSSLAPSGNTGPAQQATQPPGAPATVPLPPQPPPRATNQGQAPNQAPAQTTGPNQASAVPTSPDEKRGILNGLGQWWDDSIANFNAKIKEQQAKLDEFNKQQSDAAKNAQEAMKKAAGAMFSTSKVIEIQQLCPVAGNGAPDCATAAADVCKAKGFSDGRPMDIRTAERCKASLWVSGQNPTTANCPIETVLLRVACQQ